MSKKNRKSPGGNAGPQPPQPPASREPAMRPMRARYKLFWTLCVILAIWVVALLVLYFTTVRPYRTH